MEFIRQVGNQAEVNDGGKIRRLPFSGEGVPPQPGAKVNPVRDACCCPSSIPLTPDNTINTPKTTPRRVSYEKTVNTYTFFVDAFQDDLGYPVNTAYGSRIKFDDLKKLRDNYVIKAYPADFLLLPIPGYWVEWNSKKDTYKISRLNPDKPLYVWCESTFGTKAGSSDFIDFFFDFFVSKKIPNYVRETLTNPATNLINPIIKVMDVNQFGNNGIDPPPTSDSYFTKEFKRLYPKGQYWILNRVNYIDKRPNKEIFKEWITNPEDKKYKYERLH